MSKSQKLPAYADGVIKNECYDTGAFTEYFRKLNECLECTPCYRTKPKASVIDFLIRKQK